jgi:hypothetical protein
MPDPDRDPMDEIDRIIMGILATNPRIPYSDIASELGERGHEMTAEGVRHRVNKLLEQTNPFFLLAPAKHDWNLIRFAITVGGGVDAKDSVMNDLSELPFWFLGQGFGTYDIYAVATAEDNVALDNLIRSVRGITAVTDLDYCVETERSVDVNEYFP